MGIWVRTQTNYFTLQNKSFQDTLNEMNIITIGPQLHLITDFRVCKEKLSECDVYRVIGMTTSNGEYNLGEYRTEERALEVLECINMFIDCDGEMNGRKFKVFQMSEK